MPVIIENCFPLMRDFIFYCETIKNSASSTVYNYYTDLTLFFRFMKHHKNTAPPAQKIDHILITDIDLDFIKSISLDDIYAFFHYVTIARGNAEQARSRKASSLRMFYKYLHVIKGVIEVNPCDKLEFPTTKKVLPKYMTETECLHFLNTITGPMCERDYCIIVVFLNSGIRLSELCGINLRDIQEDGRVVIRGKGRKERIIYFNEACHEAIEEYQASKKIFFENKSYDHNALFLTHVGKRIGPRGIENIVKKRMDAAGFGGRGLSPHKLRHTAATIMYQRSKDIRALKDILGHENLSTTQIYTHVSDEQIKNVMTNNPIAVKHPKKESTAEAESNAQKNES